MPAGGSRPTGPVTWLLVLVALAFASGCGLPASGPVEEVSVPTVRGDPSAPHPADGRREVTVYFVRGSHLQAVSRTVTEPGPQAAVDLLLAGPRRSEVMAGLRTALSPQDLTVLSGPDDSGTVTVAVSRQFTGLSGGNQLLAVAQVVWTLTQFPEVDVVRFTLDGGFPQLPTDTGLSDQPVGRADYLSVAPRRDEAGRAASASTGDTERSGA